MKTCFSFLAILMTTLTTTLTSTLMMSFVVISFGIPVTGVVWGEEPLHRVWSSRISARFDNIPLDEFLNQRSETLGFAWLIDRRLDPGRPISCSLNNVSLREGLDIIASENELGLCFFDRLVYLGTPQMAGELLLTQRLLHEQLDQTGTSGKRLMSTVPLNYPVFSEPRSLLEQVAKQLRFRWTKLDRMPHDCWRENSLPALPACDLISMLLIGFNVRLQVDAEQEILTPAALNRAEVVERTWTGSPLPELETLKTMFPEGDFSTTNRNGQPVLSGRGPFAVMAQVEYEVTRTQRVAKVVKTADSAKKTSGESRKNRRDTPLSQKTISGKIQNTAVKTVFEYIENDLGIHLVLDDSLEEHGTTLETRISCEFRNSGEEEMLNLLAEALNATWKKEGTTAVFYYKK